MSNKIEDALAFLNSEQQGLSTAQSLNLDEMIADARTKLGVELKPANDTSNEVTPTDPAIVNALLAQADEFDRAAKAATRERAKITDLLAELTGTDGVLVVNGAPVFKVSTVTSRVLNQSHIKALFPDLPENAEMWSETTTTRRTYS